MEKLRFPIIVLLLIAIAAGVTVLILQENTSSCPVEIILPTTSTEIEVYVSGAVKAPGNYILDESSRIEDAIEAAGGFAVDADQSVINLAAILRDGFHVHVYKEGEARQLININTAEAWLLDALPGIGEATAQTIIDYRADNGPFENIEDLKSVKGIGDSTFANLEDKITVY